MKELKEEWVDIKWYEGLYLISNYGRVFGLSRGKILKPVITKNNANGNERVKNFLSKNGKVENKTIHNLVYEHFIGDINGVIDFIDGDYTNLRVDNLIDVKYTNTQITKNNTRILDESTGIVFNSIKEFADYIGKTRVGARYILDCKNEKYSNYKVI